METMTGYFRTLEQSLDCPKAVYRPFLVRTRQMAEDFFQSRPGATPEEAADYLGDPRELANGFLETLDPMWWSATAAGRRRFCAAVSPFWQWR